MTDNTDKLFLPTMKDYTLYQVLSTSTVPAEEVASILVKRSDVEKQIISIIKLSRLFAVENQDDKRNIQQLVATIKRKDEYIQKLLNKIALLYVSLPEK